MSILVVNAGSSSLKLNLFAVEQRTKLGESIWNAQIDGRGKDAQVTIESRGKAKHTATIDAADDQSLSRLIESIWTGTHAVLSSKAEIELVGHRVVHGGQKYCKSALIDENVVSELRGLIELAPAHEAANIRAIELARTELPQAEHVAVFDTAYHQQMSLASSVYAGPYSWYEELGIRRFGFHGINHQYCAQRSSEFLSGQVSAQLPARVISCHLGGGGSLCASLDGKSIMTTMGYTPLEGLVMRSRCGSIDPGLILHLLHERKYTGEELLRVLNEESGLKGISGLSGDMREIEREAAAGNQRAKLAFEIYVQSLSAHISALLPLLGGLDALVFTAGVGENSALVRSATCKSLQFLGLELDGEKNLSAQKNDRIISTDKSAKLILVIPAKEDLAIAKECLRLCRQEAL